MVRCSSTHTQITAGITLTIGALFNIKSPEMHIHSWLHHILYAAIARIVPIIYLCAHFLPLSCKKYNSPLTHAFIFLFQRNFLRTLIFISVYLFFYLAKIGMSKWHVTPRKQVHVGPLTLLCRIVQALILSNSSTCSCSNSTSLNQIFITMESNVHHPG